MSKRNKNKSNKRKLPTAAAKPSSAAGSFLSPQRTAADAATKTTEKQMSNKERALAEKLQLSSQRIEFYQAIFNGLLVVAAFLAIIVSYCQYGAMRQQNEEMLKQTKSTQDQLATMKDQNKIGEATLKQMQNDQRAWVIPEAPVFESEPTPELVRFRIRMKNHGTKPAVFSHYSNAWEPFFWGRDGVGLVSKTSYEQIYRRLTEGEVPFAQSAIIAPGEVHEFIGMFVGPGEEGFKQVFSRGSFKTASGRS